jgi:hypothetical protein
MQGGDLFGRLIPWLGGLLLLAVAGALLMAWTRRMAVGRHASGHRDGFGLDDLRAMAERGEITPEEYDRARRRMVDRVRSAPSPKGPETPSGKGR